MTAIDEAAIRADERAKVEREIVAWLRHQSADWNYQTDTVEWVADAIERGAHRGGER